MTLGEKIKFLRIKKRITLVNYFQDSKVLLKFGREINIDTIIKIEELDA